MPDVIEGTSRFSSNWNTCQERVVASLSGACLLAARSEVFDRRAAGWWVPAAHSDLRVLGRCVFARPQVTTVALAQWEEPGVGTKDRGRAS